MSSSSSIPVGKFLTGKCSLSGAPCGFLTIGQAPYCKVCYVAEQHGKIPVGDVDKLVNKKRQLLVKSTKSTISTKSKK